MTRTVRVLLVLLAIAFSTAPASAQDPFASRVTLDLKAVPPEQAFRVVGNTIGMKVAVDAAVTRPVDILIKDVSARTALTTMCESIGCRWTVASGVIKVTPTDTSVPTSAALGAVVSAMPRKTSGTVEEKTQLLERLKEALKQPLPAGLTFEKAPLSEVSARLSEALGLTLTLMSDNPALTSITGDFSNKTLMTALQALGSSGSNPPSLRLIVAARSAPGTADTPRIMIGFKLDPKKK